jgi:hypothetical protein
MGAPAAPARRRRVTVFVAARHCREAQVFEIGRIGQGLGQPPGVRAALPGLEDRARRAPGRRLLLPAWAADALMARSTRAGR